MWSAINTTPTTTTTTSATGARALRSFAPSRGEGPRTGERREETAVKRQLWFWVLIAIGAGIAFGLVAPGPAKDAKWLADAFLQLIKTVTAPVIFVTVVIGIASPGAMAGG